MHDSKKLGIQGECIVAEFLKKKGFAILAQNYRAKCGEIDLVAAKDEYVLFVEVKTRKTHYFPISNVVTYTKQRRIVNTAQLFVLKNNIKDKVLRFDIATVIYTDACYEIEYIENAFTG
jgi:putative endonuclease